ncbi:hypothetical protein Q5752_000954 [Cryptotrichosporon argae]
MNSHESVVEKGPETPGAGGPGVADKYAPVDVQIATVADELTEKLAHIGVDQELTPEEQARERRFVRRIDWHLMPLLLITYGFQYADKISLSSGVAFDLKTATGLVGNDYAWLSTGFYIAYLVCEFPFNYLMQRYPIDRVLSITVTGWGVCVLCMAACNNFASLMAVRTILGVLEAPVTPGFLIIISAWYRKEEQLARGMAFFAMNSFFSLFILMINYAVGHAALTGPIASWKAINLFLGSLSFVWGIILIFTLVTPANARWLDDDGKAYARARLVRNQTGDSAKREPVNWAQVREAFADPATWFLCLFTFLTMGASGGFSTFSTIILQGMGLDAMDTISYQLPWYGWMFVATVIIGCIVNRYPHRNLNLILTVVFLIPPVIGIFLEGLLPTSARWGRLSGFWITGSYCAPCYLLWSQVTLNVGGRTKKSTVQSLNFIAWCLGFIIGPQTFQASTAPEYRPGLYFCCACFLVAWLELFVWYAWVRHENARRDRLVAEMGISPEQAQLEGALLGLQDKTDRENIYFRYHY